MYLELILQNEQKIGWTNFENQKNIGVWTETKKYEPKKLGYERKNIGVWTENIYEQKIWLNDFLKSNTRRCEQKPIYEQKFGWTIFEIQNVARTIFVYEHKIGWTIFENQKYRGMNRNQSKSKKNRSEQKIYMNVLFFWNRKKVYEQKTIVWTIFVYERKNRLNKGWTKKVQTYSGEKKRNAHLYILLWTTLYIGWTFF